MTRVIDATCEQDVVTADSVSVEVAEILSLGKGPSEGVLMIDGQKAVYVTSSAQDLKETLERLIDSLQSVSSALASIDNRTYLIAADGGVPGSAVAGGAISSLNSAITGLQEFKEVLR